MFIREMLDKLDRGDDFASYVVTLVGGKGVAVSGVKRVLSASDTEIRLSVPRAVVKVTGEGLSLAEIGGGDAYVTGRVVGVEAQ